MTVDRPTRPGSLPSLGHWFPGLLASALLLLAYRKVFDLWFRADDFAWLGLRLPVRDFASGLRAFFEPQAQGTVRFLSERLFFITLSSIYGEDPTPFRIVSVLTHCAVLLLLGGLVYRLTRSMLGAAIAACLWIVNPGVAVTMCWLTTYNQPLAGALMLGALHCFLSRRMRWCWTLYLLGFGALEINLVLPAILLAYAWLLDRPRIRETLPFFLPSAAFALLHLFVIPKTPNPMYQLYFDGALPQTLHRFWLWALGPLRYVDLSSASPLWHRLGSTALTFLALYLLALPIRKKELRVLWFFFLWFLLTLAPVLPLKNHFEDYYLAAPGIGLAAFWGMGVVSLWRQRWRWGIAAATLILLFSVYPLLKVRGLVIRWYGVQTAKVETAVQALREAHRRNPDKILLVTGVDNDLFWSGFAHEPFRLWGISSIFLAPDAVSELLQSIPGEDASRFVLGETDARFLLDRGGALVYQVTPDRIRNVTPRYRDGVAPNLAAGLPSYVDLGNPVFQELLGGGWYPIQVAGQRWMSQRADLRLAGPSRRGERLQVFGFCHERYLASRGPGELRITANGIALPPIPVTRGNAPFEAELPLPDALAGAKVLELKIDAGRSFRLAPDERDLALVFGRFMLRGGTVLPLR
jgi:hypothetical protein